MKSRKPSQILADAKKLINTPQTWCKYYLAITRNGLEVSATSKDAVRWCALGAIQRVTKGRWGSFDKAVSFLRVTVGSVADWNNHSRHKTVMAGFDKAIQLARKEGR